MKSIAICLLLVAVATASADMKNFEGGWAGEFSTPFEFQVFLNLSGDTLTLLQIHNREANLRAPYTEANGYSHATFSDNLSFDGFRDSAGLRGFVQSGFHQYHVELAPQNPQLPGSFAGTWRPFFIQNMDQRILLSIENAQDDSYEAYLILGDSRAPQLMCGNFEKSGDTLIFQDYRTGIFMRGYLSPDEIKLDFIVGGQIAATVPLRKTTENFEQKAQQATRSLNDGWETAEPSETQAQTFDSLAESVRSGALPNTHSVLVAQHGKLIYEAYFDGYDVVALHDLRSAQKTFTGAAVGAAIDAKLFDDVSERLYAHLPESYQGTKESDPRKAQITLHHLLTMSSGIDAVDFGTDKESPASEDAYQQSGNWAYTIVDAPMLNDPGSLGNYGSANACLAGVMLSNVTNSKPQLFMDEALFHPLGISNYVLQTDFEGTTYGAGGMFMSPRDMLKFGQLYLNGGTWRGKQVLSKSWIEKSWKRHTTLANSDKHEGYGYFWWERNYSANGKEYLSHEARGAGGQYIAVIPLLDLVVSVTSGNFRNGKFWQPEKIIEEYIVPAVAPH